MTSSHSFNDLKFDRPLRRIPLRLVMVIGILICFSILWHFTSKALMFWLLFFGLGILSWAASYGWRQALSNLIDFLQQLEHS